MEAVRRLVGNDPDVAETLGSLVYLRLGLTMTGFHDGREESLAMTCLKGFGWLRNSTSAGER